MAELVSETRTITVRGASGGSATVSYRAAGRDRAPPLLMLHGIGSNSNGYRQIFRRLADSFRLVAWDAPGYGRSSPLDAAEPTANDYAATAGALADALGLDRFHLMGSSFGAMIAARFAASFPDRVTTLTLSAPTIGLGALEATQRLAQLRARVDDIRALGPIRLAEKRAPLLLAPGASAEILAATKALLDVLIPTGYIQAAHALAATDALTYAAQIRAPTLIVCGREDRITPAPANAERLAATIPGARLVLVPGVGHMVKLEAPDRLVAEFRAHVATQGA